MIQLYLFLSWNEQRMSSFFCWEKAVESVTLQVLDLVRLEFVEEAGWRRLWVCSGNPGAWKWWDETDETSQYFILSSIYQRNLLIQWSQCQHLEFRAPHSYIYIYIYICLLVGKQVKCCISSFFWGFISTALMASWWLPTVTSELRWMPWKPWPTERKRNWWRTRVRSNIGWDDWKSSDKSMYPLVVIDVDGLTDWTPGMPWNTMTRNHLTAIFRACFRCWKRSCGNSQGLFVFWSQLVWRCLKGFLATPSGLYIEFIAIDITVLSIPTAFSVFKAIPNLWKRKVRLENIHKDDRRKKRRREKDI